MNLPSLIWILSVVSQSWAINCYHCETTGDDKSCEVKNPSSKLSKSCGQVPLTQSENDTKKFDRFVCGIWKYTIEETSIGESNSNTNNETFIASPLSSFSSPNKGFKRQCFGIKIEKNSVGGRLHAYKVLGTINYGKYSRPGPKFTITDPKKKGRLLTYDNNMYRLCDDKDNCNAWVSSAPSYQSHQTLTYKMCSMMVVSTFFFLSSLTGY